MFLVLPEDLNHLFLEYLTLPEDIVPILTVNRAARDWIYHPGTLLILVRRMGWELWWQRQLIKIATCLRG